MFSVADFDVAMAGLHVLYVQGTSRDGAKNREWTSVVDCATHLGVGAELQDPAADRAETR
jgi:hypothetical protein